MRYLLYLFTAALIISCTSQTSLKPVSVDLSGFWKFKTGDSLHWADPSYNDLSWDTIKASQYWESQGLPDYDGYAWYRTKIILPLAMKDQASQDSIIFDIGMIDDCSQIYINGKLMAASPNFGTDCNKDFNFYHKLFVHKDLLEWDKEICIAIRVNDAGGTGGLSNPQLSIKPMQFEFVRIVSATTQNENLAISKSAEISFSIDNLSDKRIAAEMEYFIFNSNTDSIIKMRTDLALEKGRHDYSLAFNPVFPGFYYITYKMSYTYNISSVLQGRLYAGIAEGSTDPLPFDPQKIPLIYSSDLFHPHDDPDDHFDLASVLSIEEFDLRGVILDQGMFLDQKKRNGIIPVTQVKYLTGRNFPLYMGLPGRLKNQSDKALDQPAEYQDGVKMILETLEQSPVPVTLVAVGSMKDMAAAYNRNPELFKKKAGKLFLFIGDAHDPFPSEWNVRLDSCAYSRLMNSGLSVYWIPCFDKRMPGMNASVWITSHTELLKYSSRHLINYFAYMILKKDDADITGYLDANNNERDIENTVSATRWLYGAGIFTYFSDRKIVKRGDDYLAITKGMVEENDTIVEPFAFIPVSVYADEKGVVHFEKSKRSHQVLLFKINDTLMYPRIMNSVTANLMKSIR